MALGAGSRPAVGGHQTSVQDVHEALGADARATVTSLVAGTCREELRAERAPALERYRLVRSA